MTTLNIGVDHVTKRGTLLLTFDQAVKSVELKPESALNTAAAIVNHCAKLVALPTAAPAEDPKARARQLIEELLSLVVSDATKATLGALAEDA